jgi:hypothetical protein
MQSKDRQMKKIYCVLLLVLILPVLGFAQEMFPEEPVYVILTMPFTFDAELRDDSNQLYEAMTAELAWQGSQNNQFSIEKSTTGLAGAPPPSQDNLSAGDFAKNPRYIITGNVFLDQGDKVLEIYLWMLEDSSLKASQELAYGDVAEALGFIPFFMWSLTSTLPIELIPFVTEDEDIRWKNKWLYLGLQAGGGYRFYNPYENSPEAGLITVDGGLRLETQFLTFHNKPGRFFSLSVMTGLDLTYDKTDYNNYRYLSGPQGQPPGTVNGTTSNEVVSYSYFTLQMPFLFMVNFKPGLFVLSPYVGGYFHTSFGQSWDGELKNDLPLGYKIGFSAGKKAGRGIMFLDVNWAADFERTLITEKGRVFDLFVGASVSFYRNTISLSVGYEFGFLDHKIKPKPPEEQKTN